MLDLSTKKLNVSHFIEQNINWDDSTPFSRKPLSFHQWLLWVVSSFGKLLLGAIVFITGIAFPLIRVDLGLSHAVTSLFPSFILFGVFVEAISLGYLVDKYG